MSAVRNYFCFVLCWAGLTGTNAYAQDKMPVKFGKVTPQDFAVTAAGLDSSADVLVVADFGVSTFVENNNLGLNLQFEHSKRLRILKRSGFGAATVAIPLYVSSGQSETVTDLRATTYNLEDGKVVETKLDSKSVFTDKLNKNISVEKFTFPALKEGAILEYSYIQTSPFLFNLQPWAFQGQYPCLWSEYQVDIPDFYKYIKLSQGYLPFKIKTTASKRTSFIGRMRVLQGSEQTYRWVMDHVPPLKEEPYTTTLGNYIAKIEFQLSSYDIPGIPPKDVMGNWLTLSKGLLNAEDFGADLDRNNSWLDDDLKTMTNGAANDLEKTRKIYAYIRDNFTCTSHSSLSLGNPLKTVFKNRNGSEADLNLLLTAMLIHEKIKAEPVILSTRSNGFADDIYPLLSRFNYVISKVTVGSSAFYLDASEPWLGFGQLPSRCYNGYARILNSTAPGSELLSADLITERTTTTVFISNDEKGGQTAHFQSSPGNDKALDIRQKVAGHGPQEFVKQLQTAYSGDAVVSNLEFDSLRLPDQPLAVSYDLRLTPDPGSDLYYFNPMMGEGHKENPFKAAERVYPVEMPHAMDEVYSLSMEIPQGYTVEELPKPAKVLFNDDEGFFEYVIEKDDSQIQFRSRIRLLKANYKPEDYSTLRDFFGFIVKKQSEQIVFKKKK